MSPPTYASNSGSLKLPWQEEEGGHTSYLVPKQSLDRKCMQNYSTFFIIIVLEKYFVSPL